MLRLISALSIVTWASLFVESLSALWQSRAIIYGITVGISAIAIVLSTVMLAQNRPFLLGLAPFLSVLGLLPGLSGLAALFYCIGGPPARSIDWFSSISLALMLVPPFNWAILWRDYRHDIALNI
ncbi:MAG TPA: hypothetical protein VGI60_00050 [Chthoniobacterales bacterium]|jgi:hypothetical protein